MDTIGAKQSDFRDFLQDLLRLGMDGGGYNNRPVDRIQLEYVTNPYGRQPPHLLIFQDGRVERLTDFQIPVPGYGPNTLAIEFLGSPGAEPTPTQCAVIEALGAEVRTMLSGRLSFSGYQMLVDIATGSATTHAEQPAFMRHETLFAAPSFERAEVAPSPFVQLATVQDLFDILGTPSDRRAPVAPGSIFNTVSATIESTYAPAGSTSSEQSLFKMPSVRTVNRLVVVPSHDPAKPEPTDAEAFSLKELRKSDQRVGMTEFRGHYLLAKDGSLIEGRDINLAGNCWPGRNGDAIQIVVAGNGKAPTEAQRRTLFDYAKAMRKAYDERPMDANVRDVALAEKILGIDPNGKMQGALASTSAITADVTDMAKAG